METAELGVRRHLVAVALAVGTLIDEFRKITRERWLACERIAFAVVSSGRSRSRARIKDVRPKTLFAVFIDVNRPVRQTGRRIRDDSLFADGSSLCKCASDRPE